MDLYNSKFWSSLLENVDIADSLKEGASNNLLTILKEAFPNKTVRIYPFGSRVMGVGRQTSDLDIYVDIDNTFSKLTDGEVHVRLKRIGMAIKSSSKWRYDGCVGTRCPIVKAIYLPESLDCDINCSDGIAYIQNMFVKYIFEQQPIARYMVIYLREWIQKLDLQSKFRNHIIILMVIYFLQVSGFLPGICKFLENHTSTIGLLSLPAWIATFNRIKLSSFQNSLPAWIATFNRIKLSSFQMVKIVVNEEQTRKMLKDFFKYYCLFDFSRNAVCPYLGSAVSRARLRPSSFSHHDTVIQHFLDLNDNKGFDIKKTDLTKFQNAAYKYSK